MPHLVVAETMPAPATEVFDLLHDYDRRLEWDTLLRRAELLDGDAAGVGVTAVCAARHHLGGIAFETTYVSFDRPRVAAVRLLAPTAVFQRWAASIRHVDTGDGHSRVAYTMTYRTRPRALSRLLDPVTAWMFQRETARRLRALRDHFASAPRVA